MNPFSSIPEAIEELTRGNMLIVVDSPNRENQGDIIFSAGTADINRVNFLLNECRGLICVALTKKEAIRLELPLMVPAVDTTEKTGVQFTISVDSKDVTAFGISSADRAKTICALASPASVASDLVRPGHIFPLLARDGGVLVRQGHTEATVDLCRLAGKAPVGVLSEILLPNGEPARLPELISFSKKHGIKIITITELHAYLREHPLPALPVQSLLKTAEAKLPTSYGMFDISVYRSVLDNREHVLLSMGIPKDPALLRIHSACMTGDVFSSEKCDCRAQLETSLQLIGEAGVGVVAYLDQEGRGIGLSNKIRAYALQDAGLDTVEANTALGLPADAREYTMVKEMLRDKNISSVRLLTNNPAKVDALEASGIHVAERLSLKIEPTKLTEKYLKTKKEKLGHLL